MGRRGPKPKGKIEIRWSSNFAYAIGLITTDGNLSKDGRHMNLTSKDLVMITNFKFCLGLNNMIGRKARGGSSDKKYYVIQFGDVLFYQFLQGLGLTPAKSKTLQQVLIPNKFFFDFLRGCIDGDGNINISSHPESRHKQLRVRLFSASMPFLEWLRSQVREKLKIRGGWIENSPSAKCARLSFGKADSIKILRSVYRPDVEVYLRRKFVIAQSFLGE